MFLNSLSPSLSPAPLFRHCSPTAGIITHAFQINEYDRASSDDRMMYDYWFDSVDQDRSGYATGLPPLSITC